MMESTADNPPATTSRGAVLRRILNRGWEIDFFKAVWHIERQLDGCSPVGDRGPVSKEGIRFRPDVELGFPPTDIRRITQCRSPDNGEPYYRFDVTFMGLYGVATPLPLHYAVDILRAVDAAERPETDSGSPSSGAAEPEAAPGETTSVRNFLDLFHHRLVSLFYRSWTKYRYDVSFGIPNRDVITKYLHWLIGGSPDHGVEVLGVAPLRLIRYAGSWTAHPTSAIGLEGVLSDYWEGIPVAVEQFAGRWVALSTDDLNVVGSHNSRLGVDLTVGEQVYDLSGTFAIAFGPLDWETYLTFLPDGPRFHETRCLVHLYCTDPLRCNLAITIKAGEVPETMLGSDDRAGRLGYTSWVLSDATPEVTVFFDGSTDQPLAREFEIRAERFGAGSVGQSVGYGEGGSEARAHVTGQTDVGHQRG